MPDSYQNVANIELNANLTDMTIEAIKKQIEPQVNNLITNVVKLQQSLKIEENAIPIDLVWDYGSNERFDDMKKIQVLGAIQRTTAVPYGVRSKIITPILNKLIDEPIDDKTYTDMYKQEREELRIEYEEI